MSNTITLNGEGRDVDAATVAALVEEIGLDPQAPGVAVALNDEVVPRSGWQERALQDGDRVEVVSPVQGG